MYICITNWVNPIPNWKIKCWQIFRANLLLTTGEIVKNRTVNFGILILYRFLSLKNTAYICIIDRNKSKFEDIHILLRNAIKVFSMCKSDTVSK